MHATAHFDTRRNQRGIKKELVEMTLEHGEINGDRYVLSRKACQRMIEELRHRQKVLEHASKKGGISVAVDGESLITAFRANSFSRGKAKSIKTKNRG